MSSHDIVERDEQGRTVSPQTGLDVLQRAKSAIYNAFDGQGDSPASAVSTAIVGYENAISLIEQQASEIERLKPIVRRFRGLLPDDPTRLTANSPTKSDGPFAIAPMKVSHMLEVVKLTWEIDNTAAAHSAAEQGESDGI